MGLAVTWVLEVAAPVVKAAAEDTVGLRGVVYEGLGTATGCTPTVSTMKGEFCAAAACIWFWIPGDNKQKYNPEAVQINIHN